MKTRNNEKIGGNHFVAKREGPGGRITGKSSKHAPPFEHPSLEAATAEADRLARMNRGETYAVLAQVYVACVEKNESPAP